MYRPFKLIQRNNYPWWFLLVVAVALTSYFWAMPTTYQSEELLLYIGGGIAAFFHFFYSQHNHNTERFIDLFREFNARYDTLNDKLNKLVTEPIEKPIESCKLQTLYDYFNLCAEEYLYFRAGYIDSEVWHSWLKGMAYFAAIPKIRNVWQKELEQGSYYGFSLTLLRNASNP